MHILSQQGMNKTRPLGTWQRLVGPRAAGLYEFQSRARKNLQISSMPIGHMKGAFPTKPHRYPYSYGLMKFWLLEEWGNSSTNFRCTRYFFVPCTVACKWTNKLQIWNMNILQTEEELSGATELDQEKLMPFLGETSPPKRIPWYEPTNIQFTGATT